MIGNILHPESATRLQVNHLSTALLSLLLLPNMAKAAQEHKSHARLVLVSSEMHFFARISEDLKVAPSGILKTLNDPQFCTPERFRSRYPETKRACLSPCED